MIIAILVCFVLLLALGASYFTYRVAFYAPETGRDTHSAVSGAQYDEKKLRSYDGVRLKTVQASPRSLCPTA